MFKNKNKLTIYHNEIVKSTCNKLDYYYNDIIIELEKDDTYYHPKYTKIYPASEYRTNIYFKHVYGINGINHTDHYFNINKIWLSQLNNNFFYKTDYGINSVRLIKKGFNKLEKYIDHLKNNK